jgi:hypothetical protein
VKVAAGRLVPELGYVQQRPADPAFDQALDAEFDRLHHFLGLG